MIASFVLRAKKSLLVRNAAWLFAGQGLSFFVQAVYFIVLARLLGTREYGVLAGAIALVSIVSQYSTLGSGLLFLRYVSPDPNQFRRYWGNIIGSIATMGGVIVAGLWLSGRWLLGAEGLKILVPLAVSDCVFQQFNACVGQVFQTFEKMKFSAGLILLSNVLRLILAISMWLGLGSATALEWAIASLTVSGVAAAIAFMTVTRFYGLPTFSPSLFVKRAGEGFIFAISGSTTAAYNDIDKVVLSHDGFDKANGIYSMAYRVVNIGTMPIMSVVSAAFPRFFKEGAKGVAATYPMAKSLLRRTAFLGMGIAVMMFLLAPLIPHLVGASYAESIEALRWLCLIPLFRCFHLSAGDAIAGSGHQRYRLVSQTIAAVGNLSLNIYLIPRYSWQGAAWASLATDGALGIMNWLALALLRKKPAPVCYQMT